MHKDRNHVGTEKKNRESDQYLTGNMDRNTVTELLRENGFRVTRQREILIDIILNEECTCCKEIYYLASKQDRGIGVATIYRTISALEEIGALKRKKTYELCCCDREMNGRFLVELEDHSVVELDQDSLNAVVEQGLKQWGYSNGKRVMMIRHMQQS